MLMRVLHGEGTRQTWGRGITIGAPVIARNRPDQLGQGFFMAHLLALAHNVWHCEKEWTQCKDCGKGFKGEGTKAEKKMRPRIWNFGNLEIWKSARGKVLVPEAQGCTVETGEVLHAAIF